MKKGFLVLSLSLLTLSANAAEIQYTVQHLNLKRLDTTGWEHDLYAKTNLTQNLVAGFEGSYVERFSLYDKTYGGFLGYHFTDKFYGEAHYSQGIGNKILTERQSSLVGYYSLFTGITPFIIAKDSRYSDTKVQDVTLGAEVEKWAHILLIPQAMIGGSKFKSDSSHESIWSYGLRAIYYTEDTFSAFVYGSRGLEASQSITGTTASNLRVHTLTGGVGGSYNIVHNLKAELSIDHTDYKELKDQFITTTFNLNYKF